MPSLDSGYKPVDSQGRESLGVLVVEDEHMVRILVQLGLERNGFTVWTASDGLDAIQVYRANQDCIDVVLLDVRMPYLDGPATLLALRNLNPGILACFMSGDTGNCGSEELRQCGAAGVISKPFRVNDLANTLRLLARGMRADLLTSGGSYRE